MNRFFKLTMLLIALFSKYYCNFADFSVLPHFFFPVGSELQTGMNLKFLLSTKALLSKAFDLKIISPISTFKKNQLKGSGKLHFSVTFTVSDIVIAIEIVTQEPEKQNFMLGSYTLTLTDTSINAVLVQKSHITLNYCLAAE